MSTAREKNHVKLFLANIRSATGKSAELTSLTTNHDIICLTETHLDS